MGKKQDKGITREQLWKIWQFLGADNWQEILNEHKRNNRFIPAGQDVLKGLCVHPDHQDTSPSFYIYIEKGYAKCFGGSCNYYESNPLRLLAFILDVTYAEALQYLQEHYKPTFIPKKALEELEAQRLNQELKQEIFAASHQLMCNAIQDPTNSDFAYAKQGLDWLINTRSIDKGTLYGLPVAIMPELGRLARALVERHKVRHLTWQRNNNPAIPEPHRFETDATNYFANYLRDPVFTGGILLPLHVTPKEIGNFKIRSPDSSKKFTIIHDEHETTLGLFGLGWDRYTPFWGQGQNAGYAHVFEGEFDALSVMSRYVQSNKVKFPALSAGGTPGAKHLEHCLKTSGITKVYLVGDSPEEKGDDVVQTWMEHIAELDINVFTAWDRFPNIKDIDELTNTMGIQAVTQSLWDDQDTTFAPPWLWAVQRATIELDNVPAQDFRRRIEIAANHGKYLKHHLECTRFIDVIEENYKLNRSLLKREITSRDNTERGFIQSCMDALLEFMFVVGTRPINGSRNLVLYDTENRRFSNIQIDNERSIVQELAPIVGGLISFVEERVGKPPFLEFPEANSEGLRLFKLNGQLRKYISAAIVDMTQGAPDFMTATRYGQGYHCVNTKEGKQEYIVCGSDVFTLERDGNTHKFTALEGPADPGKDIIFDIGLTDTSKKTAWYPDGLTIEKLESGKKADLQQLFDDLVMVYDKGYKFKHHKVTTELLAALMMCYPIMDAFERPILMFITGDTSSGKSSLLSTFSDIGYHGIRLLHASQGYESYSAAGIAGFTDCDSRLLALDEFETGDTERGMHVSRILEMYRGLVSGEATRVRGRADGSSFSQTFRLPVIFSAIRGAERAQDLNRMLTIEMEKIPYKVNSVTTIQNVLGKDRLLAMAHELAVGMYPHALEIAQLEASIKEEFYSLQNELGIKVEWRLASSLFGPLAMLQFLGRDWKAFLKTYLEEHTYTINSTAAASETNDFLKAILRNACLEQADNSPNMTIAQLLISPEQRSEINTSNKGVYFDEKTRSLLILVDQGTGLIPYHLRGKMTGTHLKSILQRHSSALSPPAIENSGILRRVGKYLGAGIQLEDVVVFDIEFWLSEANADVEADKEDVTEEEDNADEEKDDKDASEYSWS